jgi:hypothetical protein
VSDPMSWSSISIRCDLLNAKADRSSFAYERRPFTVMRGLYA